MAYFAVTRERGPSWDGTRSMRQQDDWDTHARFIDAENPAEIEARLAEGPWTRTDQLRIAKIEPWEILLERSTDGLEA